MSSSGSSSNRRIATAIALREYAESLVVAITVALMLRFFIIAAYKIPTGSMMPTLKTGDFIFAYKLPFGVPIPFSGGERWGMAPPKRGQVVVFRYPGNDQVSYVKRVVGLPGDRIAIENKKLVINGAEAEYQSQPESLLEDLPGAEYYSIAQEKIEGSTHSVIRSRADEADFFGPVIVPPGHIFVLGDNRDSSDDSRYWGSVPLKNLEGEVVMVWMSFDWMNRWGDERYPTIRWDRVFKSVR